MPTNLNELESALAVRICLDITRNAIKWNEISSGGGVERAISSDSKIVLVSRLELNPKWFSVSVKKKVYIVHPVTFMFDDYFSNMIYDTISEWRIKRANEVLGKMIRLDILEGGSAG